jgi:hypothetical protein
VDHGGRGIQRSFAAAALRGGRALAKQAEEVVDEHERMGKPVRELLVDMDVLSEDKLLDIVAQHLGTHVVHWVAPRWMPQC